MFFFLIFYIKILRFFFIGSEYFDSPGLLFYSSFLFFTYMVLWREPFRYGLLDKGFELKPGYSRNVVYVEATPSSVAQGPVEVCVTGSQANSGGSVGLQGGTNYDVGGDVVIVPTDFLCSTVSAPKSIESIPEGFESIPEMLPVIDLFLSFVVAGYSLYLVCK